MITMKKNCLLSQFNIFPYVIGLVQDRVLAFD